MFKFITTKPIWVNILVMMALAAFLVFGFLQLLGFMTKHGQYLTVPNVVNKSTSEAIDFLESKGFDVQIQDSVYVDSAKRGTVLKQLPDPNSTVKINRTVFLTVNRVTLPLIDMPALQGKSLTYAIELLNRSHFKLGDTTFRPDFMMGSVLEQKFNGVIVQPGAKIPWGSKIDLVIGSGLSNEQMLVPDLVGLRYGEAKLILDQNGLTLAAVIADPGVSDTINAFVYRQNPPRMMDGKTLVYIQPGQLVDLWVSKEMKYEEDTTYSTKPKPKTTPKTTTDKATK